MTCEAPGCRNVPIGTCAYPTKKGTCGRHICKDCASTSAGGRLMCGPHSRVARNDPTTWNLPPEDSFFDATPAVEAFELESVLSYSARGFISAVENKAFREMLELIRSGGSLTPKQREWVKRVRDQVQLHLDDLNLLDAAINAAHDPSPFEDMREKLTGRRTLSQAQRAWAERIAET